MCNIEKALTKTVRLSVFQRAGGWCEPVDASLRTYHFRAGEPNGSTSRFSRMPALKDRTCQSLKVAASCRNLSGTAGNFARLKLCLGRFFIASKRKDDFL